MSSSTSSSVFHAYDIRGLSPQEIDAAFAARLGRALVSTFHPSCVLVGHDMRTTSVELEDALIGSLTALGVNVVRIGLCSTPMFYSAVGLARGACDLGVIITASHNPAAYNGFKLVRGDVQPIGNGSGMEELRAAFDVDSPVTPSAHVGVVRDEVNAKKAYLDFIFELAKIPADLPKMRIAIDAGNGMGGEVLPDVLARLPMVDVVPMYFEPDGNFPHHEANPLKRETLKDLSEMVIREGCAFGVAFDGDADRIGFVDEKGAPIPGEVPTIVLAEDVLAREPGATVIYDVRCSWAIPEAIARLGGNPQMSRVGHSFIKRQMREQRAVFAGEVSMHYYFRDTFFAESGDLVMLLLLKIFAMRSVPMSELWRAHFPYAHSGEMNFRVTDTVAVLADVRSAYESIATRVSDIDGVRMEFEDPSQPNDAWWFNVRASNTEPLVRLNLEAKRPEVMEAKKQELIERITAHSQN